jgi:hypothetical protein
MKRIWKWLWPNFKVLSRNLPRGTKLNQQKPQDILFRGRYLNPRPLEYETGVLSFLSRRSVLDEHPKRHSLPFTLIVILFYNTSLGFGLFPSCSPTIIFMHLSFVC